MGRIGPTQPALSGRTGLHPVYPAYPVGALDVGLLALRSLIEHNADYTTANPSEVFGGAPATPQPNRHHAPAVPPNDVEQCSEGQIRCGR